MTPYLFGYGSILWRQDFVPIRTLIGTLRGYSRVINQASTDHRGTVQFPGAVASLRALPEASVVGKLFEIEPSDHDRVFERLDVREQNGYSLIPITVEVGEAAFEAVTYIAEPGNPWDLGEPSMDQLVQTVLGAVGPSGSNMDYVLKLYHECRIMSQSYEPWQALVAILARSPHFARRAAALKIQLPDSF